MQTWFSVQLAFAKFLSKIKEIFLMQCQYHGYNTHSQISFILDRNLAKANCTENHVCTSCDKVVLGSYLCTYSMRKQTCVPCAQLQNMQQKHSDKHVLVKKCKTGYQSCWHTICILWTAYSYCFLPTWDNKNEYLSSGYIVTRCRPSKGRRCIPDVNI